METLRFVMTTTFYPPYHLGGDAMHVYHLSNELAKLGHEVHVIHSIDAYYWKRKYSPKQTYLNDKNVFIHSMRLGKISPLINHIFGVKPIKVQNIIKDIRPDVLHHHNIAGFGPLILNMKAPRVFYTAHDYWLYCPMNGLITYNGSQCYNNNNYYCSICSLMHKRPPQLWRYIIKMNEKIKNCDVIITPSIFMKNRLQELKINNNKFCVIPNFIPHSKIEKIEKTPYNFSYFLFVGVLERHKGILDLLDAYSEIHSNIESKLLIVGNGSLENNIEDKIVKKRLGDKICKLGRIDDLDLMRTYSNALAIIIPSIFPENCPLVALEAISKGKPIIARNIGGISEITKKIEIPTFNNKIELKKLLLKMDKDDISYKDPKKIYEKYYSAESFMSKYFALINK